MNEFANLFSSKRVEKGLSQGEIASMLNVTRQAVSKWENGKAMPDITLMPQIAEILGVSIEELLTGNEPEKQVEVVEKIVVQEKEVVKPMPVRKILAIVLPIVLVVVLASSLMGVYIPQAIAKNTPPPVIITPEPDPEIEYTRVFIKGKSNTNDSCFQAPLIKDKAYYTITPQVSSDFTLYFTAPKGAVITYYKLIYEPSQSNRFRVERTVIAEFDTAKTFEYNQYFKCAYFEKNPSFDFDDINSYEYNRTSVFIDLGENILGEENLKGGSVIANYRFVIDLSNCAEEDKLTEKQQVVLKQHYGFEDVIIPANGTYFVAFDAGEDLNFWHYTIKSEGIKYVQTCSMGLSVLQEHYYDLNEDGRMYPRKAVNDFYMITNGSVELSLNENACDYQIGFVNETSRDIRLNVEEIPIEEISLGQEVMIESVDNDRLVNVFKLKLDKETMLMTERLIINNHTGDIIAIYDNYGVHINKIHVFGYRSDWVVYRDSGTTNSGWIYVLVWLPKNEDVTFLIDDWDKYYREHFLG